MTDPPLALLYGENRVVEDADPSFPFTQYGNCWKFGHVKQRCKIRQSAPFAPVLTLNLKTAAPTPPARKRAISNLHLTAALPPLPVAPTVVKPTAQAIVTAPLARSPHRHHPLSSPLSKPWTFSRVHQFTPAPVPLAGA